MQASFKLSWGCKGQANDQHKKDIVSFESGNITTADRSSKQVNQSLFSLHLSHCFSEGKYTVVQYVVD